MDSDSSSAFGICGDLASNAVTALNMTPRFTANGEALVLPQCHVVIVPLQKDALWNDQRKRCTKTEHTAKRLNGVIERLKEVEVNLRTQFRVDDEQKAVAGKQLQLILDHVYYLESNYDKCNFDIQNLRNSMDMVTHTENETLQEKVTLLEYPNKDLQSRERYLVYTKVNMNSARKKLAKFYKKNGIVGETNEDVNKDGQVLLNSVKMWESKYDSCFSEVEKERKAKATVTPKANELRPRNVQEHSNIDVYENGVLLKCTEHLLSKYRTVTKLLNEMVDYLKKDKSSIDHCEMKKIVNAINTEKSGITDLVKITMDFKKSLEQVKTTKKRNEMAVVADVGNCKKMIINDDVSERGMKITETNDEVDDERCPMFYAELITETAKYLQMIKTKENRWKRLESDATTTSSSKRACEIGSEILELQVSALAIKESDEYKLAVQREKEHNAKQNFKRTRKSKKVQGHSAKPYIIAIQNEIEEDFYTSSNRRKYEAFFATDTAVVLKAKTEIEQKICNERIASIKQRGNEEVVKSLYICVNCGESIYCAQKFKGLHPIFNHYDANGDYKCLIDYVSA